MKKILLILLALVVVLIAAVVAVPFLLPMETYKQQIEAQVERATGRALKIDGPVDISLLPRLAMTAGDVRFANVAGSQRPDMVRLKGLQAELKIWPLLRGSVEVDRFVLVEPEFQLEIDAAGRPNWALGAPEAGGTQQAEASRQPAPTTGQPGGGMRLPITELKLGDIRIENGTLALSDARSGTERRIEAINLDVDLPDLQSALAAKGSLVYEGKPVELALAVERPLALAQGGSSPIRVTGKGPDLGLTFEGALDNAATPHAAGAIDLNVTSIRDLAAWLGAPITFEGQGLRKFRVSGQVDGVPTRIALNDARLALDAIEGQGQVTVDLSGKVPQVTGRLDLGAVDLNPYLPPAAAGQGAATGGAPAPREGQAAAADWSDEPIALPPIGGASVDFALSTKALKVRDLELDRSRLALRLQGTRLGVDLQEIALYGGQGTGKLDLEVVDGTPRISHQFRLEGMQALPFLTAAAGFQKLRGTANAELALQTRGRTQRQLVQNLSGAGRTTFRDGAIVGINLAALVRNVASAYQGGAIGGERATDFAELSGSFNVRNGVLTNDDLWLQAPVLRIAGRGQVNLPARTLDYRLEPKAAETLEGQGGSREVTGLLVPVIIKGPWNAPAITPDLTGVAQRALENPEAFKEEVEQQIEQLGEAGKAIKKGGDSQKMLEGVLGGQGGGGQSVGGQGQGAEAARKLLKGLFGN
jgi:AsmA protein